MEISQEIKLARLIKCDNLSGKRTKDSISMWSITIWRKVAEACVACNRGSPCGAPFLNLGVAQLAERVIWDHEAGSSRLPTQTIWPVSQAVKTPDLHSGNAGSTPVPATKNQKKEVPV